jgi:hypothetical protein
MSRFVAWLYAGKSHETSSPLRAPARAVTASLLIAFAATWLFYTLVNSFIISRIDGDLREGISWRAVGTAALPQGCLAQLQASDTDVRQAAACRFAQKAAPSRFDAFGLQKARDRKDLVRSLASALPPGNETLNVFTLAKFVSEIHIRGGAGNAGDRPLVSIYKADPMDERKSNANKAELVIVLKRQISGLYERESLDAFTGMQNFKPGQFALEDEVFMPPARGILLAQASERADALALVDGLADMLRARSFLWWRLGQALNGAIQWATVLLAAFAISLLVLRTMRARAFENELDAKGELTALGEYVRRRAASADPATLVSAIDALSNETERHDYELIRWVIEAIPAFGFLGTVYGMIMAMGGTGAVVGAESSSALKTAMGELSRNLGTAFDTTLVSLFLALIVGLMLGRARRTEAELFASLKTLVLSRAQPARPRGPDEGRATGAAPATQGARA